MKKKLLLITSILLAASMIFAGCGSTDDKPAEDTDPEDAVFDGLGFSSVQTLLDRINKELSSSGISFSKFAPNKTVRLENGYELYFESESSAGVRLILTRTSPGTENLFISCSPGKDAGEEAAAFDMVIKAVCSVLENSETSYNKLQERKTAAGEGISNADYESAGFIYSLIMNDAEEYSLQIAPISSRDIK